MGEIIDVFTWLVSNVGFPIACCILLYIQQSKQMKELTDAVNNNTLAITSLVEKLGGDSSNAA